MDFEAFGPDTELHKAISRECIDTIDRAAIFAYEYVPRSLVLCMLLDIFEATEKGKPTERWGRKASGLRVFPRTAGPPNTQG